MSIARINRKATIRIVINITGCNQSVIRKTAYTETLSALQRDKNADIIINVSDFDPDVYLSANQGFNDAFDDFSAAQA